MSVVVMFSTEAVREWSDFADSSRLQLASPDIYFLSADDYSHNRNSHWSKMFFTSKLQFLCSILDKANNMALNKDLS